MSHPVSQAFNRVCAEIGHACRNAGRLPESVHLVAVSKTHGADAIRPVLDAGHRVFGENRVQEAKLKWPDLRQHYPGIELHLIGPLQSNKVAEAVALFDVIETIDREKLALVVAAEIRRQKKSPRLLVQVNTGAEPQKAGLLPGELDPFLVRLRNDIGLTISGLMCIPPVNEDPGPHFAQLAAMASRHGLSDLSMGMSSDFAAAIACGATHVRVGSAIFGARDKADQPMTRQPAGHGA